MNEEREKVYQILELGKHIKNLHHKKGFGGLLFIDLSMIKFSKLSSYIRQLDKENKELKKQLQDASIQIQEMTEQDMWCPSNCEKLEKLQQENKKIKKQLEDYKKLGFKYLQDKNNKLENQQKEFTNYLEDKINYYKRNTQCFSMNLIEEILQKYKSIIGDDK